MIYSFRCTQCGSYQHGSYCPIGALAQHPCVECGGRLQRIVRQVHTVSVHPRTRFQTHKNNSTGTVVSNPRQFQDDLKRAGEKQSEETGIYHNYVPVENPLTPAEKEENRAIDARIGRTP